MTIRERLWQLMALDNIVDERDQQVLDQDVDSGEWGLPSQISTSERGRIPEDIQTLLQRAEEERLRRTLDRGCDRETVADVMGIAGRTTWHKEKRARAYDFPLTALESHRGHSTVSEEGAASATPATSETSDATDDGDGQQQQQLADVTVGDDESSGNDESVVPSTAATATDGGDGDIDAHIEQAIDALEALRAAV